MTRARLGAPQLGSYSAATKIALSIMLLIAAFQTAWSVRQLDAVDDGTPRDYRVVLTYWSMVMAWAVVAISLATPYIHLAMPAVVRRRAGGAAAHVGSVLFGAYLILNAGVNRSKNTSSRRWSPAPPPRSTSASTSR